MLKVLDEELCTIIVWWGQKLGNEAGSLWWFWTAVAEQSHNTKKNMTLHMSWWWFSLSTKEDGFYTLWTNLQPSLIHAQVNRFHLLTHPSNVLKSSLSKLIFRIHVEPLKPEHYTNQLYLCHASAISKLEKRTKPVFSSNFNIHFEPLEPGSPSTHLYLFMPVSMFQVWGTR